MGRTEFIIDGITTDNDIIIKTSFLDNDMKDFIIKNAIKEHV